MKFNSLTFILCIQSILFVVNGQDSLHVNIADSIINSQKTDSSISIKDTSKLVIVFAGDIMGHDTQIEGAFVDSTSSYDYERTFRHIKDYFTAADIAIGNLEVTLAGPPYKGYPQFSSPDELAIAAKDAGFDIFVTANNHALDRGTEGMKRTIKTLDSLDIVHAGIYRSQEERDARYPLIFEVKGVRLALLNYTYGTNGLKVKPPLIINRIDTAQIRKDILKAKIAKPDYIISTMHWGLEYERTENETQRILTRFLFDNGVNAIIGSHPHVVQPVKLENCNDSDSTLKCPVVYSLGNFVSNQRAQYKDGGIVVELHLSKVDNTVKFDSIAYLPYWVYREEVGEEKYTFYVLPVAKYEFNTQVVNFIDDDLWKFNRFKNDTRSHLKDAKESGFYQKN